MKVGKTDRYDGQARQRYEYGNVGSDMPSDMFRAVHFHAHVRCSDSKSMIQKGKNHAAVTGTNMHPEMRKERQFTEPLSVDWPA